jgi:hypothetical protein
MNKIPTAEDFINYFNGEEGHNFKQIVPVAMIEFAKLHVEAALEAASEKATVTPIDHEEISDGSFRPIWGVDDSSILKAYPLRNIK